MNVSRAFLAGVLGAAIMSVLWAIGRAFEIPGNFSLFWGSMFTMESGSATWFLGFVIHLIVGGLFGLLYGEIFEHWTRGSSVGFGAAIGFVHSIIMGLLVGLLPVVHPLIPEEWVNPGIFFANLGTATVITFILVHVVYGMIVGGVYETRTARVTSPVRMHRHV